MTGLRKHDRHYAEEIIKYRLNGNHPQGDYSLGITHNVSTSGACLYLLEEVQEGEKIIILSKPLNGGTSAVVKWVQKVQDGIYKAGMMFE